MLGSKGYLILAECNVGAVNKDVLVDSIRVAQAADIAFVDRSLEGAKVEVVPKREQHVWPAHLEPKKETKNTNSEMEG